MNSSSLRQFLSFGFTRWEWSLALFVVGMRLAVFSYAGSPLPYFDQWLSEFNNTLMSISAGEGFSALAHRGNEHLLITTKALTLLGFFINGYWDVHFLVICSAAIRALTAAWAFQFIAESAPAKTKILLWLLCAVGFAAPFSAYNALSGMQVCFYLADCALLWSLRTTTHWASPLASGFALVGGTVFGLASLGSAVAIPAATLAVHIFQPRERRGFWPAWLISAMLAAGFVVGRISAGGAAAAVTTEVALHAKAQFWFQIVSWPIEQAPTGALLMTLGGIALVIAFRHGSVRTAGGATIVGLGVYAAANAAFIAVSRDPTQWHMRHWDTIALLPLAALAFGLHAADSGVWRGAVLVITSAIALCYAVFASNLFWTVSWPYLERAHTTKAIALDHYRTLLLKQDLQVELDRMYALMLEKKYPFFDDPVGRFSLHPGVLFNLIALHRQPLTMLSPEILPIRSPSKFSWFSNRLIDYGWLLGLLGLALGASAVRRELNQSAVAT